MEINAPVARRLEEVAQLLEEQGANVFRVRAYRRGAETVQRLPRPVSEILEQEGVEGLRRLAGVGDRLATAIRSVVHTGRLPMLERLRGGTDPVELLETVPGIGRIQAERLHAGLGDSLLRRGIRRASVHGDHGRVRAPQRAANRAWTRAGVRLLNV